MPKRKPDTKPTALSTTPAPATVSQVRGWIVEGQQAAAICQAIAEHFPTLRADVLIGLALDDLRDEAEHLDCDAARGFLLSAYREIYRKTLEIGDFGNALSALRSFERQTGF